MSDAYPGHDLRKEPRAAARGSVHLHFEDPLAVEVEANLLDTSTSGFRASHNCVMLSPGLLVEFRHKLKTGRARVIWTQLRDGQHVSGFMIL